MEKKNIKKIWKNEFIKMISENSWLNKKDINLFFEIFLTTLVELLIDWYEIKISDLWKFYLKLRKERNWIDPKSKKKIKLPEILELKFSQSKTIKQFLNENNRFKKIKNKLF